MAVALVLLAVLASAAAADPLGRAQVAVDKAPLGFDLNELLAKLLAHLDPYDVKPMDFNLNITEISAKGSINNTAITGISGLRLLNLTLSQLGDGRVAVSLHVPAVQLAGDYVVQGALLKPIKLPLDSEGQFTFGFTNFHLNASVDLGISDKGQILLEDFQLPSWNLTDIDLQLGGLFNGDALGKMINKIIHDTLPHLITKTYHEKLTTIVTSAITTQGAAFLADLHQDHGKPESLVSDLRRAVLEAAEGTVMQPPVPNGVPRTLSPPSPPSKPTDLLSLVGLRGKEKELGGLFTFDLPAPQFYPHGALRDADNAQGRLAHSPADSPSGGTADIREASVDKLLNVRLAPAQFLRHGELSSGSESAAAQSGVQIQGLQGLLSGHGVKLQPVGEALFFEKGQLSRNRDSD